LRRGEAVRVFDDNSRGHPRRLSEVERDIEFVSGDIRDAAAVDAAMRGIDEVHHLAFVNGTATFYSAPDLVLDVGVKASSMSSTPAAITALDVWCSPRARRSINRRRACRPTRPRRWWFPIRSTRGSPMAR